MLRDTLYRGVLKRLLDRSGLKPVLSRVYWSFWFTLSRGRTNLELEGVSADFKTDTLLEYQRATTVLGEKDVLQDLLGEIEESDVFWDVGANTGVYSCLAGKRVEKVVAFEPDPLNRGRLEENLELNGVESEVHPYVLSDTDGTVEFDSAGGLGEGTSSVAGSGGGGVEVEAVRADTVVDNGVPRPDAVKIDVEGSERKVLDGFEGVLPDSRLVYVEVHPGELEEEEKVREVLEEAGYTVENIGERGKQYFLKAWKDS